MTDTTPDVDPLRAHEYDGIQEFDNRLPNWWLWTFYGAIIFSLFYWMHFHVLNTGLLPVEAYKVEMEQAEAELAEQLAAMDISDESLQEMATVASMVDAGREVFTGVCAACHRHDAGGLVGPNLTDEYWLHGNAPTDIYNTIANGITGTSMIAQMPSIGVERVQQVTAYVLSIRNTNVPDGKAPDMARAKRASE